MRSLVLSSVIALAGCGGVADGSSGACEQVGTGGERFCHNFRDTQFEAGKDVCARLRGTWTVGATCESLGYTKSCSGGGFVRPSGFCAY